MALLTVNPPPGMYKNGTPYTRKNRWTDGNLIRWHEGSTRPIGGWLRRRDSGNSEIAALVSTPADEAVRDIFAWRDNNNTKNVVFGSNLGAYHLDESGTVTDITYAGYSALNASKDASIQAGYGQNPYGLGAYGAANNLIGSDPNPPDRWYFDNFGEVLLTGVRNNGDVYELDLGTLTLSAVTNAPTNIQALCVTDQRQVLTLGGGGQPRRVQASDQEDRTVWTPAVENQAIDRTLAGTGKLLNAVTVLKHVLIVGENDAHSAKYIGPPYVMDINLVGESCGIIAAEAIARTERFAVWWGDRTFWIYDGSVQALPCDVIDFLYDDLDPLQTSKIQAFANTDYSEIWWLYQSLNTETTEVDSYVAWDYRERHWITGRLDRTAGVNKGVTSSVVMVSSDGEIYNHELDDVLPMGTVFAETGAYELGQGEKQMAVRFIYPDNEAPSDVSYELIGKQFPNSTEFTYGPYSYNNPVPTSGAQARSIKLKVNFLTESSEHGIVRLDYAPIGTGMR